MFCRECGKEVPADAAVCLNCGVPTTTRQNTAGEDPAIRMLLPVGRSGYAIAAGYLGLFSLLVVPAPLALLFGVIAVIHIKRNPDKHGLGRAVFAIIMGALGSAVLLLFYLS